MKTSSLLFSCLAWFCLVTSEPLLAVPANPDLHEVVQPDGTRITLRLRGDEYFSWRETAEGYAVTQDAADGFWKYSVPSAKSADFQPLANARVGAVNPAALGLKKHAAPEPNALRQRVTARRDKIHSRQTAAITTANVNTLAASATEPPPEDAPVDEPPSRVPVAGVVSVKNVVILASFSNHWDSVGGTVLTNYGRVDTSEYVNLYNEVGHTSDGAVGSVKDYFREVSYGKLTLESVISVWVRLPREESFYHDNQRALATDAIEAADAAGFDFSQADTDGDGWVDALDIIHSGYGEESTANTNHVWSVKGSLASVTTKDGVKMKPYHTEPALRGSSGTGIIRIGVICHETGHFFGLPDLYDTSYSSAGLGNWCLMAGGSWNGSSGASPAHFSAWCKVFLGYARTVPVHSQTNFSLARVEDNPVVGMVRDGCTNNEYFLLENRAKTGFDNASKIYPGLLIYHIAATSPGNDPTSHAHPLVKIEEADGDDSLGFPDTSGSEAGDVWTSTSGLAGGFRDQTGNNTANAMMYQANPLPLATNLFSARTNDAARYSYIRLNNFSAAGTNMTFDAQTLRTTVASQNSSAPSFDVTWAASSQATKYEIQEGSKVTLTNFTDGVESEDVTYDAWNLGGGVRRVTTNGYDGTCSYAMFGQVASVHHLTLRKPFKVTATSVLAYRFLSHISSGNGYFKFQISKDGGDSWSTLLSTNNNISVWTLATNNFASLNAQGINIGDSCIVRFLADMENLNGWNTYPAYGFAVDAISFTNIQTDGYGNWVALNSNVTTTSYSLTGKTNGTYVYRVQAFANSAWQGFGTEGETMVTLRPVVTFTSPTNGATFTEPATISLAATVATNNTTVGNVRFYNGATLLQTFTAPPYSFNWSSVGAGNYTLTAQVDYNGGLISTSSPVAVTVNYVSPTIVSDSAATTQNTPASIPVLANDSDFYGVLGISSVTQPTRGTAAISGTNVIYTPKNYWYGVDAFNYTATNLHNMAGSAAVSVTTAFPNFTSAYTNAVLAAGPVAYWRLNEAPGATRAIDIVGGYNGTNNAGLILGTNAPVAPSFAGLEAANKAYYFPSNTGVAIPALNLNTNTITYFAWVNPQGLQASRAGVVFWRDGGGNGIGLRIGSANNLGFTWNGGFIYDSTLTLPANQWSMVALVVTPTNGILYLATNATLLAWTNNVANAVAAYNTASYIGRDSGNSARYFNGAIDEVAIFNRSLSGAEIADLLLAAQIAAPIITLTAPTNGATFDNSSAINFAAAVITNGNHTLEKVQFCTNTTMFAETAVAPYQFNWSNAPAGSYAVSAKLFYDGGSVATSSIVNINVTNSAPTIGVVSNIVSATGSSATLTFAGTAGHSYGIQRSTNLLTAWLTVFTTNAPAGGVFQFTDTFNDLGFTPGSAYYRLQWLP